jgi:hypothetical protein
MTGTIDQFTSSFTLRRSSWRVVNDAGRQRRLREQNYLDQPGGWDGMTHALGPLGLRSDGRAYAFPFSLTQ